MSIILWSRLNTYRVIGDKVRLAPNLTEDEKDLLCGGLDAIFRGVDANEALGIQSKRGNARSIESRKSADNKSMALGWIAAAIRPISEDGFGYTEEKACELAEEAFGISAESLRRYRRQRRDSKELNFFLALDRGSK